MSTNGRTELPSGFFPSEQDVVCGRYSKRLAGKGNQRLEQMIAFHQDAYSLADKPDKALLSAGIIQQITAEGGSFVRSDPAGTTWHKLDKKEATAKVSLLFRQAINSKTSKKTTSKSTEESATLKSKSSAPSSMTATVVPPPELVASAQASWASLNSKNDSKTSAPAPVVPTTLASAQGGIVLSPVAVTSTPAATPWSAPVLPPTLASAPGVSTQQKLAPASNGGGKQASWGAQPVASGEPLGVLLEDFRRQSEPEAPADSKASGKNDHAVLVSPVASAATLSHPTATSTAVLVDKEQWRVILQENAILKRVFHDTANKDHWIYNLQMEFYRLSGHYFPFMANKDIWIYNLQLEIHRLSGRYFHPNLMAAVQQKQQDDPSVGATAGI